jgi:putative salt-induced outer membrane protein YdiY
MKTLSGYVLGIVLLSFSLAVVAQDEYIVMANGDRITGTITQIWDNELTIEPDYADEFSVDLEDVAAIVSAREFDIEFADGSEATASLRGADDEGQQVLVIDGQESAFEMAEIAELEEIDEYFDWDSRIDASSVINKGNTDSRTLRVTANTNLKLGDHRHIGDLTIAEESLEGVATKKQSLLAYNYSWLFSEATFLAATASYERDPIRDLQQRFILGAGVGYEIWDDAGRSFTIQGGLGKKTEEIDNLSETSSIAFWQLRFGYDLAGGDVNFYHNHGINTTIEGRRNSVWKSSTGVRYEITDLLYLNFEVAYDYESHPGADAEKDDLAVLAGFGLEF